MKEGVGRQQPDHKKKNPRQCVGFKLMQKLKCGLDVEQEVHHVAIFNDVVFTF